MSTIDRPIAVAVPRGARPGSPARARRAIGAQESFVLLLGLVGLLTVIGLVMVLSASSDAAMLRGSSPWVFFERQVLWVALGALALVACAAIDYRRWLRAMKIQTDAHTKIVDRLSSNEDLLAYMQSPPGQRFLSASLGVPNAADVTPQVVGAPFNRILWSVQAGSVLAAGGLGLWIAKNGVIEEAAQAMLVVSILAMALGLGFVVSAFASYALSRQLGLVQPHVPHA